MLSLGVLVGLTACADGSVKFATHTDAEETVSLDEAVIEAEAEMDIDHTPGMTLEALREDGSEAANDIVDLDWASDSG